MLFTWIVKSLLALLCFNVVGTQAWTIPGASHQQKVSGKRRSSSVMYAPPNMPTTETPNFSAQKLLKNSMQRPERKESALKLSQSVLASCDTLPSFPTSHGILSPETVMRMEELTAKEGHTSEALVSFLKTYKRHGPMSCLPMLSDPDILPHLTNAMRQSMV